MKRGMTPRLRRLVALVCACCALALAGVPMLARAAQSGPEPIYQTLSELEGKKFAYVNGSVYNQRVQAKIDGTEEAFYPSLAECVKAVEAGKADAAVQLSYCCELAVNRRAGKVALLPEPIDEVSEGFFFPKGSDLKDQFNELIARFSKDGTLAQLEEKWVAAEEDGKILPEQDWDAPNGTLKFATSGVIEPFSYVGEGGQPKGYDVELALLIAKELGYHLEVSTIPMDSIFASVASGKADFGGTLTETPERAASCDFSNTVMPTTISAIVKAEGADDTGAVKLEYNSLDELEGKKIGVGNGAVFDLIIKETLKGNYQFVYLNSIADHVAALQSGKVDVFAVDEPVGRLAVNENEGIGIMPDPVTLDEYGLFFQKGNPLVDDFNKVITAMEEDGTLDALKEKWTGADDSVKTMPEQDWDKPNGTLKMATAAMQEPLTYVEGDSVKGYEIEVALLVCKELGYGLQIQTMDFAGVLAAVPSGKVDFGGGATSITDERKQTMDFTVPDYHGAIVIVAREAGRRQKVADFMNTLATSFRKTFIEEDRWKLILAGLGVTVLISVCSGTLGLILGFGTVLARRSGVGWIGKLVDGYQALMGGVPLVVVLMVLYYVVFGSIDIAGEIVAIIAFTLAFGSTAGSTMWTAVDGIDIIQEETGLALGYTSWDVFKKIIFPQARQQFMPQLMGQFVSLVKDTSIVGYIAVQDLTRASDLIRSRTMDAFFPLISTAIIYFLFCRLLAWALGKITAKLDVTNRTREIEGVE